MKIEDVQVINGPLVLATVAEVEALEAKLWTTFPRGYREYVTQLGDGELGGEGFVRIYLPWRIERELAEWRRRVAKFWFWDEGDPDLLPRDRAIECIPLGDTIDGDELVFHPCRPDRVFVLPRHQETLFLAGGDLWAALDWVCESGELLEPFPEREFAASDSRAIDENRSSAIADPAGETLDEIVAMARSWAARHRSRELATLDGNTHIPQAGRPELLYEGILIEGNIPLGVGYGIAWRILDKTTGKPLGTFRWHQEDGSHGSTYERFTP